MVRDDILLGTNDELKNTILDRASFEPRDVSTRADYGYGHFDNNLQKAQKLTSRVESVDTNYASIFKLAVHFDKSNLDLSSVLDR